MDFNGLVTGHLGWIARLALAYCRDKEDAEDLAQDTVCRILASAHRYDPSRDFKPWAKTIMENLWKTRVARGQKVPFTPIGDEPPHHSPYLADQPADVGSILGVVRRVARSVIGVECVMLYAQGYDYSEIAGIVGIGVGTVKSRIHQGRKALRAALGA